jgi:hypothetical protein
MQETDINKGNQESLAAQYKEIVKNEFQKSEKIVEKVDIVSVLDDIEKLTQATHATLRQVKYSEKNVCVEVKTLQTEPFVSMLPQNVTIKRNDKLEGIIQYCYETI